MTSTWRPCTSPMPAMTPAPGESPSYIPSAASGAISRKGLPSSSSWSIRSGQQFAAGHMAFAGLFRTAERGDGEAFLQLPGQPELRLAVRGEVRAARVHLAGDCLHRLL